MNVPIFGLLLQILFILLITVFNIIRVYIIDHYSVYPVAFFELSLGLISIFCGLFGIFKLIKPALSVFVIVFGLLICAFFVFIYLLPEAGIPPAIPWLYSK